MNTGLAGQKHKQCLQAVRKGYSSKCCERRGRCYHYVCLLRTPTERWKVDVLFINCVPQFCILVDLLIEYKCKMSIASVNKIPTFPPLSLGTSHILAIKILWDSFYFILFWRPLTHVAPSHSSFHVCKSCWTKSSLLWALPLSGVQVLSIYLSESLDSQAILFKW